MSIDNFTYDDKNNIPHIISQNYRQISCLKYTKEKQVYVVEDRKTGDKYILKCALNDGAKFLETEYKFLLESDFDFLPIVVSGEQIGDGFYMIRKYFKGETLESYVEKQGCLSVKEALYVIEKIGDFIKQLHKQEPPILHRDIKPQNFLKTADGQYKIIDMETMKYYKEATDFDTVIIGTRMTAAPEQFGYQKTSVKTDIYSLGVLLVFLLTGDYSLKKNLSDLPLGLRKIIGKSTAFDPEKRYETVESFQREIRFYNRFKIRRNTALTGVIILVMLLPLGSYIYNLKDIYETKHINDEQTITSNEAVEFVNPKIEFAVRQYLGKGSDEKILVAELEQIETLLLVGDKIYDDWESYNEYFKGKWYEIGQMKEPVDDFLLDDLKYFINLKELALDLQNVDSLDGIENLPLKKISVAMNNLTDVTPLTEIETLEIIRITNNPIESLEGFENLKNVEYLHVMDTRIDDMMPVVNYPLKELNCSYSQVANYTFLESLESLRILCISGVSKETIQYINTLVDLNELTIVHSEIESLSQLVNLTDLTALDVSNCTMLTTLEGVENFEKLQYIAIVNTNISDITPIKNLQNLYTFEPSYAPITDFTPLLECPAFNNMYINRDLAGIAKEQLKERRITYNIVD